MVAQLYFTPTSCGAASYIAAAKAGIIGSKLQVNLADIRNKVVLSGDKKGEDFKAINPKGNVPTLVLDDGTLLNEGSAVLQWIGDQNPESGLVPAWGSSARYLVQSKLNYIASEVHSAVGPLFNPALSSELKTDAINKVKSKLTYLSEQELTGKNYLVGDAFTVADSYLYIVLSWLGYVGIDLSEFPTLKGYFDSIAALDFVKESHAKMAEIEAASK